MAAAKGTITFKDLKANHSTMRFKMADGKAKSDIDTLKVVLAGYSNCHVRAEALIDKTYYSVVGAGNRDNKAIITLADTDGEVHKWEIPGYNGDGIQDNEGEACDPDDVAIIQAAITALTGEAYSPLRSPIIQTK
jgi:hypothetical protein